MRQTAKEKDTMTIRYDWFLSDDETECEIREAYESAEGLVEHRMNIGEALDKLFTEFADDHAVSVYGEPSPQLLVMAKRMPPGSVKWYSLFGTSLERFQILHEIGLLFLSQVQFPEAVVMVHHV